MPARKMSQSKEIMELFYKKIQEKVQREKDRIKGRVEEELPAWAAWVFKPLAGLYHDVQATKNNNRGEDGELNAFLKLWLFLPKEWVILNDVVLEPEPDEFTQIDHVLVGPPGVFLIETKAWDGAFTGYKDYWKRKQGGGWVRCSSPTKQNKRHFDLFVKWLSRESPNMLPLEPEQWIFPLVVFTRAKWLRVDQCSMPVFDGALSLTFYIRKKTKELRLSPEQIDIIAGALAGAGPYTDVLENKEAASGEESNPVNEPLEILEEINCEGNVEQEELVPKGCPAVDNVDTEESTKNLNYEQRKTKDGRSYVRVSGSRQEAQTVWEEFKKKGEKPGEIKKDRYKPGIWYFYLPH